MFKLFFEGATAGLVEGVKPTGPALGSFIQVRLKMLTNSPRTYKSYRPSLPKRKWRPILAFSMGRRGPRKSLYSVPRAGQVVLVGQDCQALGLSTCW